MKQINLIKQKLVIIQVKYQRTMNKHYIISWLFSIKIYKTIFYYFFKELDNRA